MKTETQNSLVKFYFGALNEEERLQVEKDLLKDPEILLDYLDLKREIEAADAVPSTPSRQLWHRLQPLSTKKTIRMAFVAGLVAASFAAFYFWSSQKTDIAPAIPEQGILFDSGSEHSLASDVL